MLGKKGVSEHTEWEVIEKIVKAGSRGNITAERKQRNT